MATRPATPARPRGAASARPANRRPAQVRSSTRRPEPKGGGLPLPLRAIRGTWMGVAHMTGGLVRQMGATAHDLELEHRRDGVGLLLLALSVVVAAREWWGLQGRVGVVVHAVVAGTFGRVGYAVPLALLFLALRMMRAPQEGAANSRISVGLTALAFSACGLVHVAEGIPNPPAGAAGMRNGGGVLGFLASSPLEAAVSEKGTVPLLVLLGVFGLLVMTATPVHRIPERLGELRDFVLHRPSEADTEDEPGQARRRRGGRDIDGPREGDEAFEQAAMVDPVTG